MRWCSPVPRTKSSQLIKADIDDLRFMAAAIVDRAETLAEELTALRAEMFGQRSFVNFLAFRWMLSRQQAELLAAALTLRHATHSALSQAMRGASRLPASNAASSCAKPGVSAGLRK